jgi:hypothetical protein
LSKKNDKVRRLGWDTVISKRQSFIIFIWLIAPLGTTIFKRGYLSQVKYANEPSLSRQSSRESFNTKRERFFTKQRITMSSTAYCGSLGWRACRFSVAGFLFATSDLISSVDMPLTLSDEGTFTAQLKAEILIGWGLRGKNCISWVYWRLSFFCLGKSGTSTSGA